MNGEENKIQLTPEQIAAHNAEITAQIGELESLKDRYIAVKSNASTIAGEIEQMSANAFSVGSSLENMIICDRTIDNGNFELVGKNLSSMSGTFTEIVGACASKITEIEGKISALQSQYL